MDFIRGSSLSEGGKPIIALPSVTAKGESKIVPCLKEGAGVVTTRAHVHYIVTEYGAANLYGLNLRQRAKELIRIAHPNHREGLEKAVFERFGFRLNLPPTALPRSEDFPTSNRGNLHHLPSRSQQCPRVTCKIP